MLLTHAEHTVHFHAEWFVILLAVVITAVAFGVWLRNRD